jgi:hypothetical protein
MLLHKAFKISNFKTLRQRGQDIQPDEQKSEFEPLDARNREISKMKIL